ncbi:DEAD/DEAH box helicase family protein [Halosegnis longus]|uniref:DEAD/DEAH box helicase family protein n=1 Tax=Halosegnis longus TaxID=2216012 RepID=UPI00096AA1A3|nr:DEAD/DEAH box helicase family protein [Salella cibi]
MTDDADTTPEPAIRRVDVDLTLDTFYDALQSVGRPLATASELARELGVSQSVALDALESLARTGRIDSADVETDPRVWFPSDYKETADRERVVVFPGRRQVVVDGPSQFTRAQLSQFAHLEDANRESGYIYEVREEDVWSAPYDEFSGLQRTMRQALGERSDALEEWVRSQWERARKFRLYSHEDGYTVLEAKSADLMGNIAEQELDEGDLRALISDTEAWIADDAVAGVKRTLYEAGYPVLDTRHLDTGDDLPIDLDVDLRDYQNEWVNRFAEKRSGILVGPPGSGKTVAAMGVMSAIEGETLVLVPGRELAAQWKETIVEHTSLSPDVIGEYHGGKKEIRPVTIATYQTAGMDRHRHLFDDRKWGLIVYDEVHHIPSPIHRRSASLQAKHRLGLSVDGETMVPIRNGEELSMRPIAEFAEEHLAAGPGMERLSGVETLGVTEDGAVEWTPIQAVMRHRYDGQMYRVRGRNGREVTVTGDHSLIVFDGETMEITSKVAAELSETDYLLQPEAVPAPGVTDQTVDVMGLLDEGYVLIDDDTPESVFDPLYEHGVGDNKSRYNWKSRRSIPLSVAREIDLNRECIKGVYVHGRHSYIPPEVSTEAFARLLGLFVADGALDDGRVEFYATDSDRKSEVAAFEQVIRGVCPEVDISYVTNGENCTTLRVTGPLVRVLRSLGLSNGARDKSVPSVVLSNPTAYEPFIEGIVLGDGHRAKRERGKEMVTISTSSKQLAAGLNLLLAARGYVGGEYHRNPEVGVREGDHDTVENYLVRFNPNNDGQTGRLSLTPFTEPLQRAYDEAERYGPRRADGGTFESGLAERMRLNDDELSAVTQRGDVDAEWLTETDVAMLDVESVVEVDSEDEYVYDLSTGTENFLGDHLFCHNSATPIREDDKQQEIYTLIGPPIGTNWAALFDAGYVAEPEIEIRLVPWADDEARREYDAAVGHDKRKAAAENPAKLPEIEAILREHRGEKALVFVEYIEQGEQIAEALSVPFVSGEMRHARRRKLFDEFRHGARDVLVVSRVADEGIDLPGAEIAIAASGLGGSRRQGAQRAGRTMRPVGKARMYVLATRASKEEEFARSRTRHLQGKGIRVQERGAETAEESE